ncbi:MAG: hypothetical protein ABW169_06725 [Sphingobium sp.]
MTSNDPLKPLRALPFALSASMALWLIAVIAMAMVFRMEGRSLHHSIQHRAHVMVHMMHSRG